MEWQDIGRAPGLPYLGGALAGYLCFLVFQPCRPAFARAYSLARRSSFVWVGVALFGTVAATVEAGRMLLGGEVNAGEWAAVNGLGVAEPVAHLLYGSAGGALESFLRMGTVMVDARPLSLLLAVLLPLNVGGVLSALSRDNRGMRRFGRVALAGAVVLTGILHVADGAREWGWTALDSWVPPAGLQVVGWGSVLFGVCVGFALVVWVIWWMASLNEVAGGAAAVIGRGTAFQKAGSLVFLPVIYWGVFLAWREWGAVLPFSRNLWLLAGVGANSLVFIGVVQFVSGSVGVSVCLLRRQWHWWAGSWERVIWWVLMAVVHLVLLELLVEGGDILFQADNLVRYGWVLFVSFFRAAVYVWLLGALVCLVNGED